MTCDTLVAYFTKILIISRARRYIALTLSRSVSELMQCEAIWPVKVLSVDSFLFEFGRWKQLLNSEYTNYYHESRI